MSKLSQQPLISVIMPAYNADKYIARAIDSVLGQTYAQWELLVVNDGSTDTTPQIAQDYAEKDPRIQVINQSNQGVSAARNKGLDHAQGTFIAFIDSDDYYDLTFLEKLLARMIETDCDLVYAGALHEKENKIQGAPYPEMNLLECYARSLVEYIAFYATLIKRDFLEKHQIRFTVGCSVGEDQEFLMHCGIYAQVKSVPEVLYHYFWNPDSVINTLTPQKVHVDLASRQRSTQLVNNLYQGPHKSMIIRFLQSWEDRIVIIFTNLVIQKIKKAQLEDAYVEVSQFGHIPYCWRSRNLKHLKRAFILNTHKRSLWRFFWPQK